MTIKDKLTKCKVTLLVNQPWFGQLACYLNLIETKRVPTAAINERGDFFFNPDFIEKLPAKQVIGLVCHEILHLAFRHPFRVRTRNPVIWNIAADIKVNEEINLIDAFELPKGGLIPKDNCFDFGKFKIKDIGMKTTEIIYDEIMRNLPKVPQSLIDKLMRDLQGSGGENIKPGEASKLEKEWVARVNQATQSSGKKAGTVPAGLLRELQDLENPEVPWFRLIRERFSRIARQRSWWRPAKKHLPLYFPGVVREKGLKAAVAIDTSGSMSKHDITKAVSETLGLADSFPNIQLWIMSSDAKVWDMTEVKNSNKEKIRGLRPKGGGGTEFGPVFEFIKKEFRDKVDCLVFFTDGYLSDAWPKKPLYPVYWVTQSDGIDWPYGKVIRLKTYD